ncbi:HesA/MoeB/ThiF family protein [Cupriavidus taiwanensis]|uniref:Dinucleotide-utilizing enzyme possibly involved in molybdopterin or thiamin biosynthesis n=1 Tax=Cupriavidus taiwanensis TaxID=164546 RepID=A0A375JDZ5_9BURK|nr:ThiF family adenylyltransferase [Cupriavidus taiwanensis]SPS03062.1 Dinucleotide-utilizing enzyme possibly involved in molybdopterin or thiamin biosynthesis [Cupriavidus taiwanensis]
MDQATAVLDRIAIDPDYRAHDIQNEFLAHWALGQDVFPVFVGTVDIGKLPQDAYSSYFILEHHGEKHALIADSREEVTKLCGAWGWSAPTKAGKRCWILRTERLPAVPEDHLPKTVKDLFAWLRSWDPALYHGVQRVLEREPSYLESRFVSFAVHCPIGWIGFGFDLEQRRRLGYGRRPALYKQYLHGKGAHTPIMRLSLTDVSPSYVHSRNLAFPDLRGKRICMVGCGAIGGHLAQALVRLGAGSGDHGQLTLIDHDELSAENLGRHYLGYPALFGQKARVLRDELQRQFPLSRIEARDENVLATPQLFLCDLVIHATGEEQLGDLLNEIRQRARELAAPLLHVWIKGNGEAVQALWTDDAGFGCFRCLRHADMRRYRQKRFPLLKADPIRYQRGCQAFTPYAVSAPMQAASLATDLVIDWLKGDPSPRFRTRATENADVRMLKNQNISRLEDCPACATTTN